MKFATTSWKECQPKLNLWLRLFNDHLLLAFGGRRKQWQRLKRIFFANWHKCATFLPEREDAMQLQPIDSTQFNSASAEITDVEAGALARTTVNLFNAWKLTDAQACTLLGGLSARTWARWKEGNAGRIDRDLKMRMAHLMGIHKGVRHLFKDATRGYEWIKAPNAAFCDKSALDLMLQGELSDLATMREWLDAERSAW